MAINNFSDHTLLTHDQHDDKHQGAVTHPIYQNSLFTFDTVEDYEKARETLVDSYLYTRGNNPTVKILEERIAALEKGEQARCFASGMAAISSAILSTVQSGDHIICVDQAYGPTREFLSEYLTKFNIHTSFVDGSSIEEIKDAAQHNTKLIYLESPTSLLFELQDLTACVSFAKEIGAKTIIDNSWATPIFQKPLLMGVDLVVHSLTKYMSGHSDVVAGVIVGSKELIYSINKNEHLLLGGILSPQNASLILRGMRTLAIRMEQHQKSAFEIANFLEEQPFITKVNFPGLPSNPFHSLAKKQMSGFGSLLSFETALPYEVVREMVNSLRLFRIGVSWGGYESLATLHRKNDSNTPVVRLYIGLENPEEIKADLTAAFQVLVQEQSLG
ncbi:PLP-dependent aspartate aminotransferase family protein [Neobacillus sp. PS3-34]|uniref:trans-sulfuration enzyme family protein n=1 Tax=Neobacillus sp. PS3-34 TaxID=3070678 RepID=UPI0027E1B894|nr:PLP-dependent aspartate aminotransferase family protein [Neobacillus sp. PS3-34]WML48562.1 PLP-dependent aspartate aminotransferase family protein [Neobacillus sp. PS3-34]